MPITTKRIVYTDNDGQLHILIPAPECELTLEQIRDKDVPDGETSYIVEKSIFPTERYFRDAWTYTPD
tara:strand:+ start:26 stop:229 length:204 start_codon:yes stop_codon:yes gene_type:complete